MTVRKDKVGRIPITDNRPRMNELRSEPEKIFANRDEFTRCSADDADIEEKIMVMTILLIRDICAIRG
jgi:hypothetical protein